MPLPHNALVLVADGRKMLFLRNQGDENHIDLRTESHEQREDRKDRYYRTDAAGSQGYSAAAAGNGAQAHVGRPSMDETNFHQQEEDRWVKEAADELKKRVLRQDFETLAIVAPPKALGVLKKNLHKEVGKRIVCLVDKEMTGRPIRDIEVLLNGHTAPEELPSV